MDAFSPSRRLWLLSRFLVLGSRLAITLWAYYYVANVAITLIRPQASLIGWTRVERDSDGRILSHSSTGTTRAFISGSGLKTPPVLNLSGAGVPLDVMTAGSWAVYLLFFSLSSAVVLKFLLHVRSLFSGFARGEIFTESAIRQIRGIGHSVLVWAGVKCLQPVAALALYWLVELPAGVNQHVHLDIPETALVAGLLIWAAALAFEEGRRLQEETALTV